MVESNCLDAALFGMIVGFLLTIWLIYVVWIFSTSNMKKKEVNQVRHFIKASQKK